MVYASLKDIWVTGAIESFGFALVVVTMQLRMRRSKKLLSSVFTALHQQECQEGHQTSLQLLSLRVRQKL